MPAIRAFLRLFSFLFGVLASAVLVVALGYTVLTHFAGYTAEPVLSGSMEPTMPTGAVAFVKPIHATAVRRGDVVTFQQPNAPKGRYVTHRVVSVRYEKGTGLIYKTKGDANNFRDPWRLKPVGEVGKLQFDVPYLGYAIVYLGLRDVRVAIFLILCASFLLLALASIWGPKPEPQRAGRRRISGDEESKARAPKAAPSHRTAESAAFIVQAATRVRGV